MKNSLYIKSLFSTNDFLKNYIRENNCQEEFVVHTDLQTKGKGQQGNKWEAEKGKNLLFSIVIYPFDIAIHQQFVISQIISLSIVKTLEKYIDSVKIKWPNDIYWNDKKLCGILIENSLKGNTIKHSIIGIGLNINQTSFSSDIPNPVSLKQITGKSYRREKILSEILENFHHFYAKKDELQIKTEYLKKLFRNDGFYLYKTDENDKFQAKITDIESDGKIILETPSKEKKEFYFKEVNFMI